MDASMTRKHYQATADVIRGQLTHHPRPNWNGAVATIARRMADLFANDNDRFRRDLFYAACGLNAEGFPIEEPTP